MAKQKHPTPKTLRQGQAVHRVVFSVNLPFGVKRVSIDTYFLYSNKQRLPYGNGEKIKKMPIGFIRRILTKHGKKYAEQFFYSRRKAEKMVKLLENYG